MFQYIFLNVKSFFIVVVCAELRELKGAIQSDLELYPSSLYASQPASTLPLKKLKNKFRLVGYAVTTSRKDLILMKRAMTQCLHNVAFEFKHLIYFTSSSPLVYHQGFLLRVCKI